MRHVIVIAGVMALILVACGGGQVEPDTTSGCVPGEVDNYVVDTGAILLQFFEAERRAKQTSSLIQAPIIAEFEKIRHEARRVDVPACLKSAQAALIQYINITIGAYRMSFKGLSQTSVESELGRASKSLGEYFSELEQVGVKSRLELEHAQ